MANNGWIGVDLDGTLAVYDGVYRGPEHIGEPVPAMVRRLGRLMMDGYEVRILTARVASSLGPETVKQNTAIIQDWCEKHLGTRLAVTAEKDYNMIALYDDRAWRVETNTGRIL